MKCSLGILNFLEEISGLSNSVVFLYFFALITEEGFLISPWYSLELCIQMGISFLFSFVFHFSFFSVFVRSPQATVLHFCISFSWGWSWFTASCTISGTSISSSSGTLSIRSNPMNLFVTSTVWWSGIWFRSYLNGLVVFPTFFNFSLNLAIRSSWSEPQSAPSLHFSWLYRASLSLAAKNIINLISVLTIW